MSRSKLSRLPLPGSRLAGVQMARTSRSAAQRRTRPPLMALALAGGAVLLVGAVAVWRAGGTPVTVAINGAPIALRTRASDAAGALRAAGAAPRDVISATPALETPLRPGMYIEAVVRLPVIVYADGGRYQARTTSSDPAQIAQQAGVTLNPQDQAVITRRIYAEGLPPIPRAVTVYRAVPFSLTINGGSQATQAEVTAAGPDVLSALYQAGYPVYAADLVSPGLAAPLEPGLAVSISRAVGVQLSVDGQNFTVRTHQATVGEALTALGYALNPPDYSLPAPDQPLTEGQHIHLVRVMEEAVLEETPIPFPTDYIPDPQMELDQLREVSPGQPGIRVQQYLVRYEDGRKVSRFLNAEWVARTPEARLVAYGTRIVIRTAETADGPVEYWRRLRVLATSYSPLTAGHKQPGDPFFGLSATGTEVVRGIVATDPRVISLGTNLYVPEYGFGQALDVGGAVKGMRIDLGYDDANLVLWNQWTDVYLLPPVPPPDQMIWVLPEVAAALE